MKVFILLTMAFIITCSVSCKKCTDPVEKHFLPTDSLLVSYTGKDTLRFQIADSSGNALDTVILYGRGFIKFWSNGEQKYGCHGDMYADESENLEFNFINSEDSDFQLKLTLIASPEDRFYSNVKILYRDFGKNPSFDTFINLPGRESPERDTIIVSGNSYYNARIIYPDHYTMSLSPAKAYFHNRYGILKIIEKENRVWLKIP